MSEWRNNLKPGDEVIVDVGYSAVKLRKHKVDRTTPTQIVIGQWRFRKDDGCLNVKGAKLRLLEPTPELLEAIRRREIIDFVGRDPEKLHHVPMEFLERLYAMMQVAKSA